MAVAEIERNEEPKQFARFDILGTLVADKQTGKTHALGTTKLGKTFCKFRLKITQEYQGKVKDEFLFVTTWGTIAERFDAAGHKAGDLLGAGGYFRIAKVINGSDTKWFPNLDAVALRTREEVEGTKVEGDLDSFEAQLMMEG